MPRGKRTVFTMTCSESGNRIGTIRLHRQNKVGKSWKDVKLQKYCPVCMERKDVKLKEERHSK